MSISQSNYSALKNSTFTIPSPGMAIFQGGVINVAQNILTPGAIFDNSLKLL